MISRRGFLKAASVAPLLSNLTSTGTASAPDRLRAACVSGLKERSGPDAPAEQAVRQRLGQELAVIHQRKLNDDFLVLAVLGRCRRERAFQLHLRGPTNGSLVAYSLGLCDFQPQRFGLLFERFIDPDGTRTVHVGLDIDPDHAAEIAEIIEELPGTTVEIKDWGIRVRCGRQGWGPEPRLEIDIVKQPTLGTLRRAVEMVNQSGDRELTLDEIPEDDSQSFELFTQGDTRGVCRFSEVGVDSFLRMLKPQNLEDLMAVDALYRPRPLEQGLAKAYLEREWDPDLPMPIIRSRGAFIFYQEHITRLFNQFAGMKPTHGMKFIKAVSLRNHSEADRLLGAFKAGARERGIERAGLKMAEVMSRYADQTYCKAHAAGTALLAYQMAFVKAHHPKEFERAQNRAAAQGSED